MRKREAEKEIQALGRKGVPMTWLLGGIQTILLIGLLAGVGCQSPHTPNNLYDTALSDPQFIVALHYRQAVFMMKNAQDLGLKAERYAQLFGPDSEWAASAKWLENYYEKESLVRERLAILHAELAKSGSHSARLEAR